MNVNSNNKSTTEQIVEVVQALSSEQQKMLLIQLKKNEILEKAKKLDKINKAKNLKISMKEICSIVNEVRDGKNVVR
jgi:cell shape-determining protein MreC